MKLFVAPHNDDAVLWGSFTLLRERPLVLTVFDSYVQPARGHAACTAAARRAEDYEAVYRFLGCDLEFGFVRDDGETSLRGNVRGAIMLAMAHWLEAEEVWLPAIEADGHEQHNLVGGIGLDVFAGAKIHRYLTYTRTGGKSTNGIPVSCDGSMVRKKLQALACYKTQLEINGLGCWPHFLRDQTEYLLPE